MSLSRLAARTRAVARRVRLSRALRAATTLFGPGLAAIALAVSLVRVGALDPVALHVTLALGLGIPLLVTIFSAARRVPTLLPAVLIDRTHALDGRIAAALELAASPSPSPLASLAIEDALSRADAISPAKAFPIAVPRAWLGLLTAISALLLALTITRPAPEPPAPPPPAPLLPLLLHPDDIDAEREALERLDARPDPTAELRAAIDQTNELLEALTDRTIDRAEALRRIAALEERLTRPPPTSLLARESLLREMGDRLGHGQSTSALADALTDADAERAAAAMTELAERTRAGLTRAEREQLRQALEELASTQETEDEAGELREAEDGLERAQRESGEDEESLLQRREEEVQQLREQHEQRMQAERELERLERELAEAAEQLGQSDDPQQAAGSMDDAAEDLNRTAREQGSEEEMQQLAQQLQQLREIIRRQRQQQGGSGEDGEGGEGSGQGSQSGQSRMDHYVLRARGGDEGTQGMSLGMRSGGGAGGEGEAQGTEGEGGEDDEGTPGGTSGSAPGEDGEGGEGGEGATTPEQMLVLGEEGEGEQAMIELPGFGRSGTGTHESGGEGEGDEGEGAGHDHAPGSLDDPTDRDGDHRTVAVHGEDRGHGASRSEVIRGGAARGFASRDYERVYAEYERHAEEAIEHDEIPPGYRFYVRRYFDLIRPRE